MTDRDTPFSGEETGRNSDDAEWRAGSMITREPVSTIAGVLLTAVLLALAPIVGAFSAGLLIGSGRPMVNRASRGAGSRAPITAIVVALSLSSVVLGYPEIVPSWLEGLISQGIWSGRGWLSDPFPDGITWALIPQADLSAQWLSRQRMAVCLGVIGILVFVIAATGSPWPRIIDQSRYKRRGGMRAYAPWVAMEAVAISLYVGLMPEMLPHLERRLLPAGDLAGVSVLLVPVALFSAMAAGAGFMLALRARTEDLPSLVREHGGTGQHPPRSSKRRFRQERKGSISG